MAKARARRYFRFIISSIYICSILATVLKPYSLRTARLARIEIRTIFFGGTTLLILLTLAALLFHDNLKSSTEMQKCAFYYKQVFLLEAPLKKAMYRSRFSATLSAQRGAQLTEVLIIFQTWNLKNLRSNDICATFRVFNLVQLLPARRYIRALHYVERLVLPNGTIK